MQKFVLGAVLVLIAVTLYSIFNIISSSAPEKELPKASPAAQSASQKSRTKSVPTISSRVKKARFIAQLIPAVTNVKAELDAEYAKAQRLIAKPVRSVEEDAWLQEQMLRYNVGGFPCLLRSMHTHPISLVIAQAALETGWGNSRFYKEANNVFGIWSYNRHEPRMAASEQRGSKTIYVKKFASLDDAIRGYYTMIAKGYAYSAFRKARMQSDNPFELLRYLRRYSELRDEYVARLYYVMKANKLYTFDIPSYTPMALAEIIPEYVAQKEEAEKKKALEQQMFALNEVKVEETEEEVNKPVPCEEETEPEAKAETKSVFTRPAPARSKGAPVHSILP